MTVAGLAATGVSATVTPTKVELRTVYIQPDGALVLRGQLVTAAGVKKTLGCGTVLVRAARINQADMNGFMRGINELQAVKCLRVGLLVEDAKVTR